MSTSSADPTRDWVRAAGVTVGFVALLWVVEIVDRTTSGSFDRYGIRSRTDEGLAGIAVAPLLHAGWGHLQANSGPLLVLGFLVAVVSVARSSASWPGAGWSAGSGCGRSGPVTRSPSAPRGWSSGC